MLHKIFWTPWSSTHAPTGAPAVVEGRVTDKVDDALVLVVVGHTTGYEHIYAQNGASRSIVCTVAWRYWFVQNTLPVYVSKYRK